VDRALLSKRRGCGGALADHEGRSRPGQDVDVYEGGHRNVHRVLPTPISGKWPDDFGDRFPLEQSL